VGGFAPLQVKRIGGLLPPAHAPEIKTLVILQKECRGFTMPRLPLLFLLILAGLTGCAGWTVFGHTIGEERPASAGHATSDPAGPIAKAVTLTLTPQAREKAAADPRLKEDVLLCVVETELRARKLLDDKDPRASRTVEIVIDDFSTRSTSNAVLFGYNLGAGTLAGDISVRDADGNKLRDFRVEAQSRLATHANGEDASPLGSLYRRFANLTANNLAGTAPTPPAE
jgi:hypothetical protein